MLPSFTPIMKWNDKILNHRKTLEFLAHQSQNEMQVLHQSKAEDTVPTSIIIWDTGATSIQTKAIFELGHKAGDTVPTSIIVWDTGATSVQGRDTVSHQS